MTPRSIIPLLLVLALAPSPVGAAHPLLLDDAGTVAAGARELELSTRVFDLEDGREAGVGAAGRLGLASRIDAGLAIAWIPVPSGDDLYELLLDLKWAPGHALGWRPRPFVRPDFALVAQAGQAEVSLAGVSAGLSWEGRRGLLTTELGWLEPLDQDFGSAGAWILGIGADVPVSGPWRVAAEWVRLDLATPADDFARAGLVFATSRGDLSLGVQLGPEGQGTRVDVLAGWTAVFGE